MLTDLLLIAPVRLLHLLWRIAGVDDGMHTFGLCPCGGDDE